MVVLNRWWMVSCVCLVGALGCHKHSEPGSSSIPVVASFTPAQAPVGANVTINGTGFDGTTNVSVGGAWAVFQHVNDQQLVIQVPITAMSGAIAVVNGLGSGGSTAKFYVTPQVLSITPVTGAPGTVVTLTGYGLAGTQEVLFGTNAAVPASFVVSSANQVQATVPLGSTSGSVTVTEPAPPVAPATSATTTASLAGFVYTAGSYTVPVFNAFTPAQAATGTDVTVTGTGMSSVSGVTIGGVSCYFTLVDDTTLTVQVPAAAVTGPIALASVLTTSPVVLQPAATFVVTPTITNFTPAQGPAGTLVTLTGTGLVGTTSIAFGGATLSNFIVTGANTAQANVAPGSATGPITLVSSGVTATSPASFSFTAAAVKPPVLASVVTPGTTSQVAVGDVVTVNGSGFTGTTEVSLGGASALFTVVSDAQLTFTVPAAAVSGFIAVTTNTGGAGGSTATYLVTPTITALSPAAGPAGTTVTLTGTGFEGATSLSFNGTPANFVVVGPNQITTKVPGGATTGTLTVVASGLNGISSSFTVQ